MAWLYRHIVRRINEQRQPEDRKYPPRHSFQERHYPCRLCKQERYSRAQARREETSEIQDQLD